MDRISLSTLKIEAARRIRSGDSYDKVGKELGERPVNMGIIWKLVNEPDYHPSVPTLHKLGILNGVPRVRIGPAEVPPAWREKVREAALAEGISVAAWLRWAIAKALDLDPEA